MGIAIVTGSAGLIGAETCRRLQREGLEIIGIDNDMRRYFFGDSASTRPVRETLERSLPGYTHVDMDIRDTDGMQALFARYGKDITCVVHTAAQPSHDWAAREPLTDLTVNAVATAGLLEATRLHAPDAPFIFTSTNKVYGDRPNFLPLVEKDTRWELDPSHTWAERGIDETMSIDQCLHSVFGASKVAADVMVQEYGRYFGLKTVCFRGGCLTGPGHQGAQLHGFLAYLVRCAVTGSPYTIFGYKGKQVRDNIHAADLVDAFWHFIQAPRPGEVYNMGGGRFANCSVLEAVSLCEELTGEPMSVTLSDEARIGDHIWYISDTSRFEQHYPDWRRAFDLRRTVAEMIEAVKG